jgi:endonuclease/exonuclease/phosphatase family metal-dependent hydrolase
LYAKETEIRHELEQHNINIAFLQETDILDFDPKQPFSIPGYETYTHQGRKKRTMTLVKTISLSHVEEVDIDLKGRPETWLKLVRHDKSTILCGNIYREWVLDARTRLEEFGTQIKNLASSNKHLLLAGDFNLDMMRCSDNTYQQAAMASEMKNLLQEAGLQITDFGPTFVRVVKGKIIESCLDWTASSNGLSVNPGSSQKSAMSDHRPIVFSIPSTKDNESKVMRVRNLKKINKKAFLNHLAAQNWEIIPTLDVEDQAKVLRDFLLSSFDMYAPLKEIKAKKNKAPKPSCVLKDLRRKRDTARGKNCAVYKTLRNKCVSLGRTETHQANDERIRESPSDVWKILKESTGQSGKQPVKLKEDGKTLNYQESASGFNDFFLSKVETIKKSIDTSGTNPIQLAESS